MRPSGDPAKRGRPRFFEVRPLSFDAGDMLVQIVAVALGVVIGFAVTSWNEQLHQRKLLRETVENIASELQSNQTGMRVVTKEHAKFAADLAALVAPPRTSVSLNEARRVLRAAGPFRVNVPLGIAWQIAQSDQGLTLLPYSDRYSLAWIYQFQTVYYNAEERVQSSLLNVTESPNGNYYFQALNLANQERSVVSAERQLDGLYTQAIKEAKQRFRF